VLDDLRLRRMRWHCRRGTRELDRLLERWLTEQAPQADEFRLSTFEAVLACEDRDLQRWILGYYDCERDDLRELIDEIRARPVA
jgi:antitoxin CptB